MSNDIITGRNEVVAKVMFLHVCVILFTGVGLRAAPPLHRETPPGPGRENPSQDLAGRTPPRDLSGRPPWDLAGRTPPGTWQGEPPPGPGRENLPGPGRENPPKPASGPGREKPPPDLAGRTPSPRDLAGRPPRTRQTPPPGRRLQHTVTERPVRILLECILVYE